MMTMSVWKEQILLHWDGVSLPKDCIYPLLQVKQDPGLLKGCLKHSGRYMKYSKTKGHFFMSLSKQNLQRVHKDLGDISIREGYSNIAKLKVDLADFKMQQELAVKIKAGLLEDIAYKVKPLGEYQHIGVNLLIHMHKAPLFVDCGCLAADTEIKFHRRGVSRTITIEALYKRQQNPRTNRIAGEKTKIRAFKGDHIGLHPIVKVVQSGEKEVYLLTLADGKSIKATADHEILTSVGFVQMQDLTFMHEVMVDNLKRHQAKETRAVPKKSPDKRIAVGKFHPYARKQTCHEGRSFSYLLEIHRAIWEADQNALSLEDFVARTYVGPTDDMVFINPKTHHVHHVNGDHYDNSVENLQLLTATEHAKHHTKGYENFNHGVPEHSQVLSVTPVGKEMTYDIVCEDPHRNFVANGIVVHNCGKTFMALVSTQEQFRRGLVKPGKVLICGKLATLETGWLKDTEKFTHMKAQMVWLPQSTKNRKQKLAALLDTDADIFVINHDGVRVLEDELVAKNFEKVVIDESTILKGFKGTDPRIQGGQFGKAVIKVAANAKYKVIMTGTPAPNGPEDLWGQFRFLDNHGFLLEKTVHDFRNTYMEEKFFGNPNTPGTPSTWVPGKKCAELPEVIAPLTYRLRIRDHLKDLPEETNVKRSVKMSAEQSKGYKEMEEALRTILNDQKIAVDTKLVQLMKLRQITGGFLIDNESNPQEFEQNPKAEMLDSLLLEEINKDEKVVIFAEYRWEIEMIASRYKAQGVVTVYGGNNSETNLRNIKEYISNPEIRLAVMHPVSAAHGITFTHAHYMVFYSESYSAEQNYQARARIKRAGQKNAMFFYYLICANSIDEIIYEVIARKNLAQEGIIDQAVVVKNIMEEYLTRKAS